MNCHPDRSEAEWRDLRSHQTPQLGANRRSLGKLRAGSSTAFGRLRDLTPLRMTALMLTVLGKTLQDQFLYDLSS